MSAKASTISESSLHCTTIGFVPFYFFIRLTTFSAKPKKSDRIEVVNSQKRRIIIMKENLKVLMINGSPKANGNTAIALKEMENIFKENSNWYPYK